MNGVLVENVILKITQNAKCNTVKDFETLYAIIIRQWCRLL